MAINDFAPENVRKSKWRLASLLVLPIDLASSFDAVCRYEKAQKIWTCTLYFLFFNRLGYFCISLPTCIWTGNQTWKQRQKVLNVNWSDFHFSSFDRVVISFPVIPVDSISERWVFSVMIQTVQVGVMAGVVPPCSFEGDSTILIPAVIVLIFGWKGITTLTRKRITSISWNKLKVELYLKDCIVDRFCHSK